MPTAPGAARLADEATVLAVILAHASSAEKARPPRPPGAVLRSALASAQHLDKIVPRFLSIGPAAETTERLALTPAAVARVVRTAGGTAEGIPEAADPIGWSRAYELFWIGLGPLRTLRLTTLAARSARAAKAAAELGRAIDGLEQVDALVADDRLEEAFLLCRSRLEEGLACYATRHAALCFHLATDLPSMKTAMATARPLLPRRMVEAIEAGIDARMTAAISEERAPALAEYFAYLPPCYWVLTGRGREAPGAFEQLVASWTLLQRPETNPDAAAARPTVVAPGDPLPRGGGPVLSLDAPAELPAGWLAILPRFLPPAGAVRIERRIIANNAAQALVAGIVEHDRATIGSVAARATDLGAAPETPEPQPFLIFSATAIDRAPVFDSVTVIGTLDDSPTIVVPAGATCTEALLAIDAHLGAGVSERLPCLIRAPEIAYPAGYVQRLHARFEQNARHAAVAAAGVALDREDHISLDRRVADGMLLATVPLALCCAALADLRQSLLAQPGTRFYDALLLPRLPAIFVRLDRDVAAGNERTILDGLARAAETAPLRQLIFERQRRGLARWLTTETSISEAATGPFLDVLNAHERLMSDIAAFVRGDRAPRTLVAVRGHVRRRATAGLVAEGQVALLREFVLAACDDGPLLGSFDAAGLRQLFDLARRIGVQGEAAHLLVGHAAALVMAIAGASAEVFPFLAGAVERDTFAAVLLTALAESLASTNIETTREIVTIFAGYASPDALAIALDLVARSGHAGLLDDPALLASTIPDRSTPPPALIRVGLTMEAVRASAPVADQLHRAIAMEAAPETLIGLMRRKVDEDGALGPLIELLRVYSALLAPLGITSNDWAYHLLGHADHVIRLAAIFADAALIKRLAPEADAEGRAIAADAIGDPALLERLFAELGGCEGLAPVAFTPDRGITGLFEQILAAPPPAQSGGPLVSIVMTVFEPDLALLDLAIRSALSQTHAHLELLLVDDGSSAEIAAALAERAAIDPRIRLLTMPANAGPYACRNLALRQAAGEFVAIHDGDDVAHPQRLETQIAAFAGDPALLACASRHLRFDALGHVQIEQGLVLFGDGTMSTMFRRAAFDRLGGFLPVRSRGDVEFRGRIRRVYGPGAIATLPCPLMFCHSGPATLSHRTYRERRQALTDFRRGFRFHEWVIDEGAPRPLGKIVIPWSLRP